MRRVSDVRTWARWEMSRRIDVTPFLRFIILERFVKGGLLMAGGIALFVAGEATDLHRFASDVQGQFDLTSGDSLLRRAIRAVLRRLGGLSTTGRDELAVAVLLYGLLEVVEGVGLVLRRRWAEYLLLIATAAFLPLEVEELTRHVTVLKVAALLLNVAIVVYLIRSKRLFLEHPEPGVRQPA